MKAWKRIFPANGSQIRAGVAIFISYKTLKDCNKRQRRTLQNNKEIDSTRRYNICKYLCNQHLGAPKYINQILPDPNGDIDSMTIIVGDFNTPLSTMDTSSR